MDDVKIAVELPEKVVVALSEKAKEHGCSVSEYIIRRLATADLLEELHTGA